MEIIKLLGISGSLRKGSYNTAVLNATTRLLPTNINMTIFSSMEQIPLFNPDREQENIAAVEELKNALKNVDGLLIASPEYAHGISGVLKNTLDWLVSGEEFPYLPVALFNTSPRATHAQVALREVLTTMSARLIEGASISVPLLGTELDSDAIVKHPEISNTIQQAMANFRTAIIESGLTSSISDYK